MAHAKSVPEEESEHHDALFNDLTEEIIAIERQFSTVYERHAYEDYGKKYKEFQKEYMKLSEKL